MSTPVDDIEVEEGLEVGEELNLTPDPLPEVRNSLLKLKHFLDFYVIYQLHTYQNDYKL